MGIDVKEAGGLCGGKDSGADGAVFAGGLPGYAPLRVGGILLSSNILMAPLAGYTCYPFRILCQELGAGLCFTEMVSANALKYKDKATARLLFTTPDERIKAVQLLGSDPAVMERAACSEALSGFDIIDINMGCPVPNVFKSGEGSALMGDLRRASAIIRGCKKSGKTVTVKTRIGIREDDLFAARFAKMCEDSGADMISIHGRSRSMMYDGAPYYSQIEQAKAAVSIPVIANGGIASYEDAKHMLEATGADGIMIGRYGLQDPFIFSRLTGLEIHKDKCQIILEQMELASRYYDETFVLGYIRKLASYCMKKQKGSKSCKQKLYQCGNTKELTAIIKTAFGRAGEEGEA